jgi:hypothetical protein
LVNQPPKPGIPLRRIRKAWAELILPALPECIASWPGLGPGAVILVEHQQFDGLFYRLRHFFHLPGKDGIPRSLQKAPARSMFMSAIAITFAPDRVNPR